MGNLDNHSIEYIAEQVKKLQYPSVRKLAGGLLRKISLDNYIVTENKKDKLQIKSDDYLCSFRFEKELDLFIEVLIKNAVNKCKSELNDKGSSTNDSKNEKVDAAKTIKDFRRSNCLHIAEYFESKEFNKEYISLIYEFINTKKNEGEMTKKLLYVGTLQYYEKEIKPLILKEFLKDRRKHCAVNMPEQCRREIINQYLAWNMFAKYNDNVVVLDSKNHRYIADETRKIFPIFLKKLGLFSKIDQIDESMILYILNNYVYNYIKKPIQPCLLNNIKNVKKNIFYKLYNYEQDKLTNDEYEDFDGKIRKIKILLKLNEQIKEDKNEINKLLNSEEGADIEFYINLIKTLYDICDGIKENFNQIAELLAVIFMGQDLLEKYKVKYNNFTVICTNNKKLVEDFLRSLFILNINKLKTDYTMHEMYEFVMHDACGDIFENINDYGVTDYSLSSLCSSENISKFIDDQLAGIIVNISSDIKGFDKFDENRYDQLLKLNSRSEITAKHKYLGKQVYTSDQHYVFITNDDSRFNELKDLKYQCIQLSQKLPPDATVFHSKMQLNLYERAFMLTNVVKYGIDLLLSKNANQNNDMPKLNYAEIFIKDCCISVEYDTEDGITAENATALKTLEGAFGEFYKLARGIKASSNVINNYIRDNLQLERLTRKSAAIVERDSRLGYEKYVLTKTGGGTHVFGLILKPLEEVKKIAEEYGTNKKLAEHQMSLEEFIELFAEIGNFNPIEFDESDQERTLLPAEPENIEMKFVL